MAVAAIGLTPISPTIEVTPVVEIHAFERITNVPALPSSTGAGPAARAGIAASVPRISVIQTDIPAMSFLALIDFSLVAENSYGSEPDPKIGRRNESFPRAD